MTNYDRIKAMTLQEAINIIEDVTWQDNGRHYGKIVPAREIAISALEKQIPKKVELYKHNGDFKWANYPCPYCGEMLGLEINKRYVKFCPNCGQALDFNSNGSDTNDR